MMNSLVEVRTVETFKSRSIGFTHVETCLKWGHVLCGDVMWDMGQLTYIRSIDPEMFHLVPQDNTPTDI